MHSRARTCRHPCETEASTELPAARRRLLRPLLPLVPLVNRSAPYAGGRRLRDQVVEVRMLPFQQQRIDPAIRSRWLDETYRSALDQRFDARVCVELQRASVDVDVAIARV